MVKAKCKPHQNKKDIYTTKRTPLKAGDFDAIEVATKNMIHRYLPQQEGFQPEHLKQVHVSGNRIACKIEGCPKKHNTKIIVSKRGKTVTTAFKRHYTKYHGSNPKGKKDLTHVLLKAIEKAAIVMIRNYLPKQQGFKSHHLDQVHIVGNRIMCFVDGCIIGHNTKLSEQRGKPPRATAFKKHYSTYHSLNQ